MTVPALHPTLGAMEKDLISRAAEAVARARALVLTAGAGMGVDSGLPDFRGNEGFWRAYPPFQKLGLSFVDLASPRWFRTDPQLAWGFYGHRLMLYRRTVPHPGFGLLSSWTRGRLHGSFVLTSNVDGQFQRAGFAPDRIVECHGSIHHVQCTRDCGAPIVEARFDVDVDPETFRARDPLPSCESCGALVRPSILMFGDGGWDDTRTRAQEDRLAAFLESIGRLDVLTVVECGAGTHVPTVRSFSEGLARAGATLVRINVREPEVPAGGIGIPMKALDALRAIDAALPR